MRKNLIIIILAFFAIPMFAQSIEGVDVSKAPNGKFTTSSALLRMASLPLQLATVTLKAMS